MECNFKYFENIYWIDLVIEGAFKEDLLLGNTLSAIHRLKEKSKNNMRLLPIETIIGLDLITLGAFPLARSLDDLSSTVKEWPLFAFNYIGEFSEYDTINALTSELETACEIIPIIHSFNPFDENEHGKDLSIGIKEVLKGNLCQAKLELSNENEEKILNAWPFLKPTIDIREGKIFDNNIITWLGVNNIIISRWLTNIFIDSPRIYDLNSIENMECSDDLKLRMKDYVLKSKLFQFCESTKEFILKFSRSKIIPLVRRRSVIEFADKIQEAQAIGVKKDPLNRNRSFWFFHFDKFFNSVNCLYIEKLKSMLAAIISSYTFEKICFIENGENEIFNTIAEISLIECLGIRPKIVRAVRSRKPRLFPFEKIGKNDNLLIITDIVNTGKTVDSAIDVINQYGANLVGIITLVLNCERLKNNYFYEYKEKIYPIWYLMNRELLPVGAKDMAKREEVSKNIPDIRSIHDYAFFWELLHKGGGIQRNHYMAKHSSDRYKYESHFDVMFDFSDIKKAPELLQDLLSQFDFWRKDRIFTKIISNTSKFAPHLSEVISSHLGGKIIVEYFDFNKNFNDPPVKGNERILFVDDGINTYSSLSRIIRNAIQLGYKKEQLCICTLVERQCYHNASFTEANKLYVEKNSLIFVYYKTAIPYFLIEKDSVIKGTNNCPICYLNDYYNVLFEDFNEHCNFGELVKGWMENIPLKMDAPLKIKTNGNVKK